MSDGDDASHDMSLGYGLIPDDRVVIVEYKTT
jgi:hypothetical protein